MRYAPPTTLSLHPRRFPWFRVLLGALGVVWATLALRDVRRATEARRWPEADGVVGGAIVQTGTEYRATTRGGVSTATFVSGATLEYSFRVRGTEWTGWRVNVTDPAQRGFRFRPRAWLHLPNPQGLARRYPTGRRVTVRYNAADPRDAALDVSTPYATWIELALGVGLVALVVPYRRPARER